MPTARLRPRRHRQTLSTALFVLACAVAAHAETLKVPSDDYPTIQSAIDEAEAGDVITVAKGTYHETVSVYRDGLTLIGKKAVIDPEFDGPCMRVEADDVTISGFVLVNGTAGLVGETFVEGSFPANRLSVSKCLVRSCDFGITVRGEAPSIQKNVVLDCKSVGITVESTSADPAVLSQNVVLRSQGDGIRTTGLSVELERNTVQGCLDDGIEVDITGGFAGGEVGPPSLISRNRVTGALVSGLEVYSPFGALITIERNRLKGNGRGLEASGVNYLVVDNDCSENAEIGMLLGSKDSFHFVQSEVRDNTCSFNGADGLRVDGPLLCRFADQGSLIIDNSCQGNGRDGIVLDHPHLDVFQDNVCKQNGGEGIDLMRGDDMTLDGNVCIGNEHEGIDNTASDTVLRDNVCKGNARGEGPDLAGTGKAGAGSVIDEGGNQFKTGGFDVASRLDIDDV